MCYTFSMSGGFLPQSPVLERPPVASLVPPVPELTPLQADELAIERLQEEKTKAEFLEQEEASAAPVIQAPRSSSTVVASPALAVKKDEALLEVEKILEDGLGDFVTSLP